MMGLSPDTILSKANLTQTELQSVITNFEPLEASLTAAFEQMENMTEDFALDGLTGAMTGEQQG